MRFLLSLISSAHFLQHCNFNFFQSTAAAAADTITTNTTTIPILCYCLIIQTQFSLVTAGFTRALKVKTLES